MLASPGPRAEPIGAARHVRSSSEPSCDSAFPEPCDDAAFCGLAGQIVEQIAPHTEADPVGILAQLLVAFGSIVGHSPHYRVEATNHHTNEFVLLVGNTSKARKGTAWGYVTRLFAQVDPEWRAAPGLTSGEGLIHHVRDPVERLTSVRDGKASATREMQVVDPGVKDKRLLAIESEFAGTLKVMGRDGNTLSPTIRDAWDGAPRLQTLSKQSPEVATGAHISIIGHITLAELRRQLSHTEMANGFANRFLFVAVRRARCLPEGGNLSHVALDQMGETLRKVVERARHIGQMSRDPAARQLWLDVYPQLSDSRPGLLGAVTARSEAHVLRLSLLYALLNESDVIGHTELQGALALWDYSSRSAAYAFGDGSSGVPERESVLEALRIHGQLNRTQVSALFSRHKAGAALDVLLEELEQEGLVQRQRALTGGRPREEWTLVD